MRAETVALGDLYTIVKGRKASSVSSTPAPGSRRMLQINDLRGEGAASYTKEDGVLATSADILIAWDGANAGTVGYGLEGNAGSTLAVLKPFSDRAFAPYVGRFLQSKFLVLNGSAQGAAVPHVNRRVLESLAVPLPPLREQHRASALLDKAETVKRKRQCAGHVLQRLLGSAFVEIFGDPAGRDRRREFVRLDEIADIVSGVTIGRKLHGLDVEAVPYLRVANVQDGRLDLAEVKTTPATAEEVAKLMLRSGDLVLTEGGDPDKLGRGAVWQGQLAPCIHQNHVFRVRLRAGFAPDYVSALLGSGYGKRYFLKAAKQTTGIASINRTQLAAFPVIVAPYSLQRQYEAIVARVTSLSGRSRSALEVTERLRDSITQLVFGGHA